MNSLYLFFNAFTVINLIILFTILFFRKNNSKANRILALIVITPGLNFITNLLVQTGLIIKFPFAVFLFQATSLVYSPMVLAYVVIMTGQKFKLISLLNIITALAIILEMYFAIDFSMMPYIEQNDFLSRLTSENYPIEINIMNGVFSVMGLAYLLAAFIHIYNHTKTVKNFYSDIERIKVRYVQYFIILHIVLNLIMSICYAVLPTKVVEFLCIPIFINILYVYIVYYAFNHSAILTYSEYCNFVSNVSPLESFKNYQEPLCREVKEIKQNRGKSKYKLTEIELEENYNKILQCFKEQKPYLDPNINLTKFSSLLNACSHTISLTINTRFETNFFDLINSYRVKEAQSLLQQIDNKNVTIEACGFDAGFNSKMAFYRAFKKHVHMTPTEYIQSVKN